MILFVLISSLLLVILYKIKFFGRDASLSAFPRLGSNFLLHSLPHLFSLNTDNTLDKFTQWHEELGEVFLMTRHVFDRGLILVSDPEIAKKISFHQPNRPIATSYVPFTPWLGSGEGFILEENNTRSKQVLKVRTFFLGRERLPKVSNSTKKLASNDLTSPLNSFTE
jgi:hypothetical protein